MKKKKTILAISGSTRHNSVNIQIIKAVEQLCIDTMDFKIYTGLTDLPYFNPDLDDENVAESVKQFRNEIANAEGVLICTPEYVFSLPGVLKNAIEWLVSTVVFSDKPTAIITASASGVKAHESLLLIMKTVGAKIPDEAALLISGARAKMKERKFTDDKVLEEVKKLIMAFEGIL